MAHDAGPRSPQFSPLDLDRSARSLPRVDPRFVTHVIISELSDFTNEIDNHKLVTCV